jgi:predicted nucleic acid-binding Zn ribbon protein
MAQKTCPYCGAPVDPNRSACPNCRKVLAAKSPMTPYIIVGILIVVIVVIVAVLLINPVQGPGTSIVPLVTVQPTSADALSIPPQPTCFVDITPSRASSSAIQLQVISTTCGSGDITALQVSINGVNKGTLGTSPGASATFAAPSSSSIVVTAKFANGAESVVYQNPAL